MSLWVSEAIGWPVVAGWMLAVVGAVAFVVVETRAERRRKRMLREWGERR